MSDNKSVIECNLIVDDDFIVVVDLTKSAQNEWFKDRKVNYERIKHRSN